MEKQFRIKVYGKFRSFRYGNDRVAYANVVVGKGWLAEIQVPGVDLDVVNELNAELEEVENANRGTVQS